MSLAHAPLAIGSVQLLVPAPPSGPRPEASQRGRAPRRSLVPVKPSTADTSFRAFMQRQQEVRDSGSAFAHAALSREQDALRWEASRILAMRRRSMSLDRPGFNRHFGAASLSPEQGGSKPRAPQVIEFPRASVDPRGATLPPVRWASSKALPQSTSSWDASYPSFPEVRRRGSPRLQLSNAARSHASSLVGLPNLLTQRHQLMGSDSLLPGEVLHMSQQRSPDLADGQDDKVSGQKFQDLAALAAALVERCGSLERAFASFDYNHSGKVTRTQFDTTLSTFRINVQELCGLTPKQVFKMMDCLDGAGKGEVQFEKWNRFFTQQLEGTLAADLLTEDRGDQTARQLAEHRSRRGRSRHPSAGPSYRGAQPGGTSRGASKNTATLPAGAEAATLREESAEFSPAAARQRSPEAPPSEQAGARDAKHCVQDLNEELPIASVSAEFPERAETTAGPIQQEELQKASSQASDSGQASGQAGDQANDQAQSASRSAALPEPRAASQDEDQGDQSSSSSEDEAEDTIDPDQSSGVEACIHGRKAARRPKILSYEEMAAKSSAKELRSRDDSEIDAEVEEEVLAQELEQLDLSGIQALAYIFVAKMGSLKKAFKWFDATRHGKIAQVVWDTGMVMLHIDTEKLTGFKHSQIFSMMDNDPNDGVVTRKEWRKFFACVEEDSLKERLQQAAREGGSIAERTEARKRKKMSGELGRRQGASGLESSRTGRRGSRKRRYRGDGVQGEGLEGEVGDGESSQDSDSEDGLGAAGAAADDGKGSEEDEQDEEIRRKLQEESFRARARRELLGLAAGESLTYSNDRFRKWQPASAALPFASDTEGAQQEEDTAKVEVKADLLSSDVKLAIVEELAAELDLWTHSASEGHRKEARRTPLTRSTTLSLMASEPGGGVLVCNLRPFAEDAGRQLEQLKGTSGSLEFPASLSEVERLVVHVLAAEQGLTSLSEGSGPLRRVVAYDTGDFAVQLRRMLETIQPGGSKALSPQLSAAQRRLVHTMAMEMGLTVSSPGGALKVFNLRDFAAKVREDLARLASGEVHDFDPNLSEQERQVVHEIASELGLTLETTGSRTARQVSVANLRDFLAAARARMEALQEPDETAIFGPPLTTLQQTALRELATELGLNSGSRSSQEGLSVLVSLGALEEARTAEAAGEQRVSSERARLNSEGGKGAEGGVTEGEGEGEGEVDTHSTARDAKDRDQDAADDDDKESLGVLEDDVVPTRELSEACLISRVFEAYATGNHQGQRVFLRFSDLREFAEDMKGFLPQAYASFHQFTGILEFYFDDTIQLQFDFGERGAKGLTLRWFQVFVQKAMRRLGVQIIGVLMALIDTRFS